MPNLAQTQVKELASKASAFALENGEQVVLQLQSESVLVLEWLGYLSFAQRTGVADSLLVGAGSSIRESAACLSLGMVRPALFALRTQIDLILAWLYFKDHPVEWKTVNDHGEGFKLKREILDYLAEHNKGYAARFAELKEVSLRRTDDPYRLLSAHVHAQSGPVLPETAQLHDVVYGKDLCLECTLLARDIGEFLGDILSSVYAPKWAALPPGVRSSVDARLATRKGVGGKKGAPDRFFSGL